MSMADMREYFDVEKGRIEEVLLSLEKKGLVKIYRTKKGIELAKATYEGLNKAHSPEYYRWYPSWITKDRIF
jgi:DNA-binding PadR family transcriptional regulator